MKHFFLSVILLCVTSVMAQENFPKVSVQATEAPIKDVLYKLENSTSYKFYYIEDWLKEELITVSINSIPLNEALPIIFNQTSLNYYISKDKKIILTKNTLIYDQLPEGFFNEIDSTLPVKKEKYIVDQEKLDFNPVFFENKNSNQDIEVSIVRIGKESKNNSLKTYTLTGFVADAKTQNPISRATLKVIGKNSGSVTRADGTFTLRLQAGLNKVIIRSLGYKPIQKNIIMFSDGELNVLLKEKVESLGLVVIDANKDKNIKTANTGTVDVDVKKIKNIPLVLGERDIFKVATTLPGITTAGEGSSGFNIRGGKTDQNLILLDGGVLYNPTHFFGIFSAINPFTTSKVTIYKGNIPSEFGGRLSSVIDIETKNGNVSKLSGEASIGPVTGNLSLEIPLAKDKSSLLIGGRSTYSDWVLKAIDNEDLKNSVANYYDAIVKYHNKVDDNNTINLTGYYSKDKFSITADSLYGFSNRLLTAEWKRRFNDKNSGSVRVSNSQYTFSIDYNGNANRNFKLGYKNNETQVQIQAQYNPNKKHSLTYGYSGKLYSIFPGEINPKGNASIVTPLVIDSEKALENAIFISDKFKVNKQLMIHAGIRYSYYLALGEGVQRIYNANLPKNQSTLIETKTFGNNEVIKQYGNPEIRLATRYLFPNDLAVKAGFNTTVQYIHSISNNTTDSPTDTWKLSDTNIKPQKATQYTLGVYKNYNDTMYELSLEGFYKRFKNVLDFKVGSQFLLNETLETEVIQGVGKAYGAELLLKKHRGKFNGWISYTYSRSFYKMKSDFSEETINNGNYFPSNFDKPHNLNIISNFKITERFSLSGNFIYQTGRPVTIPEGKYIFNNAEFVIYSDRNAYRIPDYYRLDLSLNIEGTHKIKKLAHSFWNISVYNVLGRNNPYSVFFVTDNGEVKAYQSSIFAVPVPTITYNLKF